MERTALQQRAGRVDIVVVYKIDRLTRSLADFARLVEIFDTQGVSFVSVTQQFNTTSSRGRLTLNVVFFAQFEREVYYGESSNAHPCRSKSPPIPTRRCGTSFCSSCSSAGWVL
jgi:hypothetical protein